MKSDKTILFDTENYCRGFLVDDEWMGGIDSCPENTEQNGDSPSHLAYVLEVESGNVLYSENHSSLEEAIQSLNSLPRAWVFQAVKGKCGSTTCGKKSTGCETCKVGNPQSTVKN